MEQRRELRLCLTADLDNDFTLSAAGVSVDRNELRWRGVAEGVPLIVERLRSIKDDYNNHARFSWFVRCDDQIGALCETREYLLKHFKDLLTNLATAGDEIAWHPHVYRQSARGWQLENDAAAFVAQLERSYQAFINGWGQQPLSARIGEAFGANFVISTLARLGLKLDSSALPGRRRIDEDKCFDWEIAPAKPYYPSRNDYRLPGADAYEIIELPMSMVATKGLNEQNWLRRYLNLSFYPTAFDAADLYRLINEAEILVTIVHPFEVLSHSIAHSLIAFDIDVVFENLNNIIALARQAGRRVRFIAANEVSEIM
jgi:hypothetical protein